MHDDSVSNTGAVPDYSNVSRLQCGSANTLGLYVSAGHCGMQCSFADADSLYFNTDRRRMQCSSAKHCNLYGNSDCSRMLRSTDYSRQHDAIS
ncbi:MAG TPA: hypothetical protein HPP76_06450 [Desulfuromonadales bacterium]|nr:hypothetical protein [Desulfuromonadales bacterium]